MKRFQTQKGKAILSGLLVFIFLISAFAPALDAGVCERALQKCMVDAGIAGLTGGAFAGFSWAALCLTGYEWCLHYYAL
jgi:hypothetical protein